MSILNNTVLFKENKTCLNFSVRLHQIVLINRENEQYSSLNRIVDYIQST